MKNIEGRCSTKLRIAILQDEIALWEKRCDTEPRSNLYYGYIRDMMTNRVKELSVSLTVDDTHRTITENTSGEYFDAQRKRQIEAMQNKNTLLHKEWREDFDKRQMDKKEKSEANYIDENTQLFWWESIDHN